MAGLARQKEDEKMKKILMILFLWWLSRKQESDA